MWWRARAWTQPRQDQATQEREPDVRQFGRHLACTSRANVRENERLSFTCWPCNVNRIKMIKRQMYGQAGFDLLRKRVLFRS